MRVFRDYDYDPPIAIKEARNTYESKGSSSKNIWRDVVKHRNKNIRSSKRGGILWVWKPKG